MALSQTQSFATKYKQDVSIDNCYIKVAVVTATKSTCTALVWFMTSQGGEQLEERPYFFAYDINGENPIRQAYLHLKTLPEFANAVDC
jgi:hypothetical protein